jgi:hypothetical protein
MPAGGRLPRSRGPHIRNIRAIFHLKLLDQFQLVPAVEHVELGCNTEYERWTRGLFSFITDSQHPVSISHNWHSLREKRKDQSDYYFKLFDKV